MGHYSTHTKNVANFPGFGIGSMIHSALTFGHYFEVSHLDSHCSDAIQAIKPLAHLSFTFVQMYFIFMNSKVGAWINIFFSDWLLVIKNREFHRRSRFEDMVPISDTSRHGSVHGADSVNFHK